MPSKNNKAKKYMEKMIKENEEKIKRGCKVKCIPEHNQIQKFSEPMQIIIEKQKNKAQKIHNYKVKSGFKNRNLSPEQRKFDNLLHKYGLVSSNIDRRFKKVNLNSVILPGDVVQYKQDLTKQYSDNKKIVSIPYTQQDIERKFGFIPSGNESILDEILEMQKRGL